MLFHVSEEAGIERFEPRHAVGVEVPVVWAISEARLHNYLLPRDCPRVTFFAGRNTTAADRRRLLGDSACVVAVESGWRDRIRSAQLFCYRLPSDTFHCVDETAGYFHSAVPVAPVGVDVVPDVLQALTSRGVELRLLPSLFALRDAVVDSTLSYSIIRMRNARG
jgi:hypothetical protein